jgi:antitoxin MazE
MMTKKLARLGNSVGIVIDKPILELLGIDPDGEVDITTDGERLVITPHRKTTRARARDIGRDVMRAHRKTLDKLAK